MKCINLIVVTETHEQEVVTMKNENEEKVCK